MKLRINCMQCSQEQGQPTLDFQSVEIRDDGLYSSTCNNGHTTLTVIQEQKFEVLFDFGVMALIDGYPREAVTGFAASLERFYEFYVFTTCLKHDIELAEFQKTWKQVANQSERQFGAYLFAYLMDHNGGNAPVIDDEKPDLDGISRKSTKTWKEFRNAVVHKGYVPSFSEAIAYGNIVYLHLNELILDLKERSGEYVQKATFHHIARAHQAANDQLVSTFSIPTLVSLIRVEEQPKSLRKAMESIAEYRKWLHHV